MDTDETMKFPTKANVSSGSEGDDSDDETFTKDHGSVSSNTAANPETLKVRREKRLAMNRASARARRRRKKDLLDTLSTQVSDLTNQKQALQTANEGLKARVEQLEAALHQATNTITAIASASSGASGLSSTTIGGGGGNTDEARLRSLLLGAGISGGGCNGTAGSGIGLGLGDSFINARAAQLLQQQNQMKLLEGLGASGAGGGGLGRIFPPQQQQPSSADLGFAGLQTLGSLLSQNLGQNRVSTPDFLSSNKTTGVLWR